MSFFRAGFGIAFVFHFFIDCLFSGSDWLLNNNRGWGGDWCWLLLCCLSLGLVVSFETFSEHCNLLHGFHLQHSASHLLALGSYRACCRRIVFLNVILNKLPNIFLAIYKSIFNFFKAFPKSLNCLLSYSRIKRFKSLIRPILQNLLDTDFNMA